MRHGDVMKARFRRPIWKAALVPLAALLSAGAASAQLLPPVGGVIDSVGRLGDEVIGEAGRTAAGVERRAGRLVRDRLSRLRGYVRDRRDVLEMSEAGPVVRGRLIALDFDDRALARARGAGFGLIAEDGIGDLGVGFVTLSVPAGMPIDAAAAALEEIAPAATITANHIHFAGGSAAPLAAATSAAQAGARVANPAIGVIDGGVAAHPAIGGVEQRGFARGAPAASAHGTAVASLAAGRGPVNGGAPGAALLVADIYGDDPAGGSATALARAIGWMAGRGVPVVTISLAGPANALVERTIARARARGIEFVAAVGNDGPAAPPAYPASYAGVIAVTGVDRRNRVLAEAGRAAHLDYAAPGADMRAASHRGGTRRVRGTSFAAPLVAGRLAALGSRARLDAEARDLGAPGPDAVYGRGLVCGDCRNERD